MTITNSGHHSHAEKEHVIKVPIVATRDFIGHMYPNIPIALQIDQALLDPTQVFLLLTCIIIAIQGLGKKTYRCTR